MARDTGGTEVTPLLSAKRGWKPMALEYVGHVADVMKTTHKSGKVSDADMLFSKVRME
jgi:hypothetical protein